MADDIQALQDRIKSLEDKIAQKTESFFIHQSQIPPGTIKERHLVVSTVIAKGDLFYADGNNNFIRLPIGTTGQILKVANGVPTWV